MMYRLLCLALLTLLLTGCQPIQKDPSTTPPSVNEEKQDITREQLIPVDKSSPVFKVKRVIDGDTFELADGRKVRLIGVNTPETHAPNKPVEYYGQEAAAFTKATLEGKKVRLQLDVQEKDKYGRILAYVFLEQGPMFNAILVKEGYAQVMTVPPNVRYAELFRELQKDAKQMEKGLWGKH